LVDLPSPSPSSSSIDPVAHCRVPSRPSCVEFSRVTSSLHPDPGLPPLPRDVACSPERGTLRRGMVDSMANPRTLTVTPMCRSSSPRLCAWLRREYFSISCAIVLARLWNSCR
jgi:hypothetical protein